MKDGVVLLACLVVVFAGKASVNSLFQIDRYLRTYKCNMCSVFILYITFK